ncbi:MAG: response regulator transcription factor [Rhodothermales bacterium]|nr:response regulator transcription factor [Rhodothermales bacterium]
MARSSIRVWVVEDNDAQRMALCAPLSEVTDMHCAASFPHGEALLAHVEAMAPEDGPDVVLMDVELDSMAPGKHRNGVECTALLRALLPDCAVVMLTVREDPQTIFKAFRAGACGYITKQPSIEEVVNGIREAHRGGMYMSPPVARLVMAHFTGETGPDAHILSDREREILRLMERGLRQKQIAETLFLSPHTIDSHLRHIYQKLHVNSAAEALARAIRKGEI